GGWVGLAVCAGGRAAQRRARHGDRGGAAVIADGHVFVIRQQRIVGAEQLARIGGVVDAGEKVGVVADRRRKLEAAIVGAVNEAATAALPPWRAPGHPHREGRRRGGARRAPRGRARTAG